MTIRRPSVDPIPMDASDRTDEASENSRVDPPSLNIYEPDLARCANCGPISMLGLEKASDGSPRRNPDANKTSRTLNPIALPTQP